MNFYNSIKTNMLFFFFLENYVLQVKGMDRQYK